MQSIDEILRDITSMTKQLVRKLTELENCNEKLRKENKQLKQKLLAKDTVDLFNMPQDTVKDKAEGKEGTSTTKKV